MTVESQGNLKPLSNIYPGTPSSHTSSNQVLIATSKHIPQPKILKQSNSKHSANFLTSGEKRQEILPSTHEKTTKTFRLIFDESLSKENEDTCLEKEDPVGNHPPIKCLDITAIPKTADGLNSPLISPGSFFRSTRNYEPPFVEVPSNLCKDAEKITASEIENGCPIRLSENSENLSERTPKFSSNAPHLQNLFKALTTQLYPSEQANRNLVPVQALSLAAIDNQIKGLSNEELSRLAAEIKKEHKFGSQASIQKAV